MLKNQQPFKSLLQWLTFYGFIPTEVRRLQIIGFVVRQLLFGATFLFIASSTISAIKIEDVNDVSKIILFSPVLIFDLVSAINIQRTKLKIVALVDDLGELFKDPATESFLAKGLKSASICAKYIGSISCFLMTLALIDGIVSLKLSTPIWLPFGWLERRKVFLAVLFVQYTFGTIFFGIFAILLTLLPNCFLFVINAYADYLRVKLRQVSSRESLIQWIEVHRKFNK